MPALTPRGRAGGGLSTRACQRPKQSRRLSLGQRQRLNSSLPTTLELSPPSDDPGSGGRGSPRHPTARGAPSRPSLPRSRAPPQSHSRRYPTRKRAPGGRESRAVPTQGQRGAIGSPGLHTHVTRRTRFALHRPGCSEAHPHPGGTVTPAPARCRPRARRRGGSPGTHRRAGRAGRPAGTGAPQQPNRHRASPPPNCHRRRRANREQLTAAPPMPRAPRPRPAANGQRGGRAAPAAAREGAAQERLRRGAGGRGEPG